MLYVCRDFLTKNSCKYLHYMYKLWEIINNCVLSLTIRWSRSRLLCLICTICCCEMLCNATADYLDFLFEQVLTDLTVVCKLFAG